MQDGFVRFLSNTGDLQKSIDAGNGVGIKSMNFSSSFRDIFVVCDDDRFVTLNIDTCHVIHVTESKKLVPKQLFGKTWDNQIITVIEEGTLCFTVMGEDRPFKSFDTGTDIQLTAISPVSHLAAICSPNGTIRVYDIRNITESEPKLLFRQRIHKEAASRVIDLFT